MKKKSGFKMKGPSLYKKSPVKLFQLALLPGIARKAKKARKAIGNAVGIPGDPIV